MCMSPGPDCSESAVRLRDDVCPRAVPRPPRGSSSAGERPRRDSDRARAARGTSPSPVGSDPARRIGFESAASPGGDSGRARPRRGGATLCCVGPRAPRGQAESGSGSDLACEPSDQFSTQAGRAGPLSALVRRRLIRERTPRAVAGVASQLRCRRSWPRCARPVDRLARVDSNDKWGKRVVRAGDKMGQQQVNKAPLQGPISTEAFSRSDAALRAQPRAREPGGNHS
jgi:hypothetical protein